jgi:hypothetical protein
MSLAQIVGTGITILGAFSLIVQAGIILLSFSEKDPSYAKKIPWIRLVGVFLSFAVAGFLSGPFGLGMAWIIPITWAAIFALVYFLLTDWALGLVLSWALTWGLAWQWNIAWYGNSSIRIFLWILFGAVSSALTIICAIAMQNFLRIFGKFDAFTISAATSLLGICFGWFIYQLNSIPVS